MLSRVVPASGEEVTIKVFGDYEDVASWAETAFRKMVGKGYIGGSTTGNLNPVSNLTRAQAAKLLDVIYENENIVSKKSDRGAIRCHIKRYDLYQSDFHRRKGGGW